jgi:hypothetical protein
MNADPAETLGRCGWRAACAGGAIVIGLVCGHIHRAVTTHRKTFVVATACPRPRRKSRSISGPSTPSQPEASAPAGRSPIRPAYALHWWNGRELVTHWQTATTVLARYDARAAGHDPAHAGGDRPG